jgi:hypothetical protein
MCVRAPAVKRVCEEPLAAGIITYICVTTQRNFYISAFHRSATNCATNLRAVEGHNMLYWHKRFVGTYRFHLQGKDAHVCPSEFTPSFSNTMFKSVVKQIKFTYGGMQ